MPPLKISSVSYINSIPFNYGIKNSSYLNNYDLKIDVPSECARKLLENEADIALLPVGALLGNDSINIISDLCIGANGDVATVVLAGNNKIENAKKILLDTDSRTSVLLVRILAKHFWNIDPIWENSKIDFAKNNNDNYILAIGDKVFDIRKNYPLIIDLSGEWKKMTNLPFVFAVWATKKELPQNIINDFNNALKWGCANRKIALLEDERYINNRYNKTELIYYLKNNISYSFDEQKINGMKLFFNLVKKFGYI